MQSSTIVKVYRKPSNVGTEKGPQVSICIKSRANLHKCFPLGKGRLFCLAKGHISHTRPALLTAFNWVTVKDKKKLDETRKDVPTLNANVYIQMAYWKKQKRTKQKHWQKISRSVQEHWKISMSWAKEIERALNECPKHISFPFLFPIQLFSNFAGPEWNIMCPKIYGNKTRSWSIYEQKLDWIKKKECKEHWLKSS